MFLRFSEGFTPF